MTDELKSSTPVNCPGCQFTEMFKFEIGILKRLMYAAVFGIYTVGLGAAVTYFVERTGNHGRSGSSSQTENAPVVGYGHENTADRRAAQAAQAAREEKPRLTGNVVLGQTAGKDGTP